MGKVLCVHVAHCNFFTTTTLQLTKCNYCNGSTLGTVEILKYPRFVALMAPIVSYKFWIGINQNFPVLFFILYLSNTCCNSCFSLLPICCCYCCCCYCCCCFYLITSFTVWFSLLSSTILSIPLKNAIFIPFSIFYSYI